MKKQIALALAFLIILAGNSQAGKMSPELVAKVNSLDSDSQITVWIKLPRTYQPQELKTAVSAAASTRNGRYIEAYDRISQAHQQSQMGLLHALENLQRSGRCDNIKAN
jgi:hypothetical protein